MHRVIDIGHFVSVWVAVLLAIMMTHMMMHGRVVVVGRDLAVVMTTAARPHVTAGALADITRR